jgi:predicted O-linked N-acetylglucosamine transferase (SPINDLY family)
LREYHAYLERTRHENPLFDTRGFARDWEALLERAYEGTVTARGRGPDTLTPVT